jgi:hypothetical protein
MGIVSVFRANRPQLAAALIGMLAFAGGCGSGEVGESTAASPTPPPGRSRKEREAAIEAGRAERLKEAAPKKATGPRRRPTGASSPKESGERIGFSVSGRVSLIRQSCPLLLYV